MSLSLIFTIISKSTNCRLLMWCMFAKELRICHTAAFSFLSTMQNHLSSHTFRKLFNFENCHLLFPCRQCQWHSWLLGCSRETKASGKKLILSDRPLRLMATSHHVCCRRCVLLQTCHVRYSSGHVWSQLPDSFMMGSCERKDCMWLSIRLTLNIWDSAVKA